MDSEETSQDGRVQSDTPSLETPFESVIEETALSGLSFESVLSDEISESGWSSSISTESEETIESKEDSKMSEPPPSEEVIIGGNRIKLAPTARTTQADDTPMFKKEDRKSLSEDKRNDLFEKATKNVITKFDLLSMSIKDEDKLDETYNVHILLAKMKAHVIKYDMHDVFTILDVDDDGKGIKSTVKNLFVSYPNITEAEVAKSNKWYNTWPVELTYQQNLQLTFQLLENNTSERLWDKCMEVYEKYNAAEKGGPLMFIIMMKKLQVDTDAAVQYLQTSVKQMKITNFDGEDVSRVVSLIRGAHKRLKGVGENKVPTDFAKQITMVLQTSTVPEFNEMFQHLTNMVEIKQRLEPGADHWPKPDALLDMAEAKYLELHHIDKWTGVNTTKAHQSVFKASQGKVPPTYKCFNCNGNHLLTACPVVRDEARIERNKTAFQKAKQDAKKNKAATTTGSNTTTASNGGTNATQGSNRSGKYAPPTQAENNRRLIDGKWHKYNPKKNRWYKERNKGSTAGTSATTATAASTPTVVQAQPTTTNASTVSSISAGSTDSARSAVREAALQNAAHMVNVAMRGMVDACREPN